MHHEHHLKEGRTTRISFELKALNQQSKWKLLMVQRFEHCPARLFVKRFKRQLRSEARAQSYGIDEVSDD